jgi:hypothetical protein
MLTQKLGGNFQTLQRIPDAKGAQGSDLARFARKDPLSRFLVKKMRQGAESTFGKGQMSAFLVLRGKVAKVRRGDEVKSKLNPRRSTIKLTRVSGPR